MAYYYKVEIDRVIRDRIEVIVRSDKPRDMNEIERESEATAQEFPEIKIDEAEIAVSAARIELHYSDPNDNEEITFI
jgi:K+/H+ antiporter YhaU regulatory subunit KhtT